MNKRQAELQLQGQVQKSVFSLLFNHKEMRSVEIKQRLGNKQGTITNALNRLIELGMVERLHIDGKPVRGAYKCTVTQK